MTLQVLGVDEPLASDSTPAESAGVEELAHSGLMHAEVLGSLGHGQLAHAHNSIASNR